MNLQFLHHQIYELLREFMATRGVANGLATLGPDGLIDPSQLPDLVGSDDFRDRVIEILTDLSVTDNDETLEPLWEVVREKILDAITELLKDSDSAANEALLAKIKNIFVQLYEERQRLPWYQWPVNSPSSAANGVYRVRYRGTITQATHNNPTHRVSVIDLGNVPTNVVILESGGYWNIGNDNHAPVASPNSILQTRYEGGNTTFMFSSESQISRVDATYDIWITYAYVNALPTAATAWEPPLEPIPPMPTLP